GLPGARRPAHHHDLAGRDRQVDVAEDLELSEPLVHVPEPDRRGGHQRITTRTSPPLTAWPPSTPTSTTVPEAPARYSSSISLAHAIPRHTPRPPRRLASGTATRRHPHPPSRSRRRSSRRRSRAPARVAAGPPGVGRRWRRFDDRAMTQALVLGEHRRDDGD